MVETAARVINFSGVLGTAPTIATGATGVTDFRHVKRAAGYGEASGNEEGGLMVWGHGHEAPIPSKPLQQPEETHSKQGGKKKLNKRGSQNEVDEQEVPDSEEEPDR